MDEHEILDAIDEVGVITWWPGGASHDAIVSLCKNGVVEVEDCSTSQETVFEVRRTSTTERTSRC